MAVLFGRKCDLKGGKRKKMGLMKWGLMELEKVMYDKYSGRSRRFAFVTMKTIEDANAVIEKLNDTEIGGRKIKVNITEKPLQGMDRAVTQAEDSQFVESPYKVYVGNLAKTVTNELLKDFFSEKGNVLGAKVQRTPGTSKSSGFGFVCFSSDEEVEAAIEALNNAPCPCPIKVHAEAYARAGLPGQGMP
uniref:Small ribosomal subunit protein cS22 n=1 Tax=Chenopodium quinoa TaxID=63459 RepID=A0A803LTL9_CHEQI